MFLEVKGMFTIIGMSMIAIIIGLCINTNFFIAFILIFGILFYVLGDMILYMKIISSRANMMLEPNHPGEEKCLLFDMGGNFTIVRTVKKEEGKREFVRYGKEATVINRGKYPVRIPNGDRAFIGHESYDKDVDLYEAEALDKLPGDDIIEIYNHLKSKPIRFKEES
jgi:uncharacterized protein YacL (UPF0231 family)